jgi:hypothetical protein
MHRELEWPVSKATCLYKKLVMVYSFLYTIIEGTSMIYFMKIHANMRRLAVGAALSEAG